MNSQASEAKRIFLAAVEQSRPEQWPQFLDEATGEDADLRQRVEALLEAHQQANRLLDDTGLVASATGACPTERPGIVIDRYQLVQQIGEGGMGVVFRAEQTEPVQREVAVKIIKPGMDTRRVIERFEAERQALAVMDHPHVAKVLDAGSTSSGRPYFVMELVAGVSITEYCDRRELAIRQRLELFIPVCQAVQHAHQKGIIHRDLKPSNILVEERDGRPVPKVIDFGVAKAIDQGALERTAFTQDGQIVGTPEYMSPEQAQSQALVDTRTDVYSLGVVLYELLTGDTPLDRKRLRSAAWDEMMRVIREEDPPTPSAKLSSSDALPSVAARRRTEPARLGALVRGELDWIVMKALDKERARRYESPSALARDIENHLHDQPVLAGPPSAGYRFRKFARRNKRILATVALVALAMIVGTAASVYQAVRATRAEHLAEARLEEAEVQRDTARNSEARADQARVEAEKARVASETARIETRRRLANSLVASGARLMDDGDIVRSLPYFVAALQAEEGDPDREAVHRTRIAMTIDQCPRFTHCLRIAEGHVTEVFFDDTDRCHAVVIDGREVQVWDVVEGRLAIPPLIHDQDVELTSVAPDRKGIVTTAANTAWYWDLGTGTLRHGGPLPNQIKAVAFSEDARRVALSDAANTVEVFHTHSGVAAGPRLQHPRPDREHPILALDADGSRVVLALRGHHHPAGRLMMWDVASGEGSTVEPGHSREYRCVAFSPDGRWLATTSHDATIRLTDTESRKPVMDPLEHGDEVVFVQFSADGQVLLTASLDGTARIWDLTTGREKRFPLQHQGRVLLATFSHNGRYVLTAGDEPSLRIWDVATGELAAPPLPHFGPVRLFGVDRLARRLATVAEDTVFLWDLALGEPESLVLECRRPLGPLAFFPCGERLATVNYSGEMSVWKLPDGDPMLEVDHHLIPVSVAVSPDGSRIVSVSRQLSRHGIAMILDAVTGHAQGDPLRHEVQGAIGEPSFDRERNWLLTAAGELHPYHRPSDQPVWKEGRAHLWCLETGERLQRAFLEATGVRSAQFSPNGQWVVLAGASVVDSEPLEGFAEIWDVASDTIAGPPIVFPEPIFVARFSPDSTRLALGGGRWAQVFRVPDGEPLTSLLEHQSAIRDVLFSPRSDRLLTRAGPTTADHSFQVDPTARVWDAVTGQPCSSPLHHHLPVNDAAFTVDGRFVGTVSGSVNDPSIGRAHGRLWDASTGQPVSPALNHDLPLLVVERLAFSPDGRYLVTGSRDTTVRIWRVLRTEESPGDLMRLAELFSGHRLDVSDSLVPLTADELDDRWQHVAGRFEPLFTPIATQVSLWHRRQAAAALWHRQVPAAIGHLDPDRRLGVVDGILYYLAGIRRDPAEAVSLLEEMRELTKDRLRPEHPDVLSCVGNLVTAYYLAGRLADAITLLEQTPGIEKARSDPGYNGRPLSTIELAMTYYQAGRYAEATELFEQELEVSTTTLGPKHPSTLISMGNLSAGYSAVGRTNQALTLREELLKLQRSICGPEHEDTLSTMANLAAIYHEAGRLDEAMAMQEEALELRKATLGLEHPSTLHSMHNLASAYRAAGRLDESLLLHEQSLAMYQSRLGPEHPHTLYAMHGLALSYRAAGRLDESLTLFEQTLELRTAKLGANHADTLNTMGFLADTYREQGRSDEALTLFQQRLELQTEKLGAEHPSTLTSMNRLALAYRDAGRLDEALTLFQQTLELRTARLGTDHADTIDSLLAVAVTLRQMGHLDKAIPMLEETLSLSRAKLYPDQGQVLSTLNSLAVAYGAAGRIAEAVTLLEEVVELNKARLGTEHPSTYSSMANLAAAYHTAGRLDDAIALQEEALELRKSTLGPEHPDTLHCMHELAVTHARAGHLDQAAALIAEAIDGRREALGAEHPGTLDSLLELAGIHLRQGAHADAEPLLLEAHQAYARRREIEGTPRDRQQTEAAVSQLIELYEQTDQGEKAGEWREKLSELKGELPIR